MDAIDLDVGSSFDVAVWINSDEAATLQKHLEGRVIKLLFSDGLSDSQFRRLAMQLAWLGAEPQNKPLLAREIVQLSVSQENQIVECRWKGPEKLWKGACNLTSKTVSFVADHATEILIGAAIIATGVGIGVATGYTISVAVSGVVVAGAGSIFTSEEKPNPHIPQHLPYPSKDDLASIQQWAASSSLPDPELPKSPDEFLVTSKGIWTGGQFYSNESLMKHSLSAAPSPNACPHTSIADSAPFLDLGSQLLSGKPLYQIRGENSLAFGLYTQALEDLNKAIAENPANPTPYLERGAAHFALKEYEQSLEDFGQFVSQVPTAMYPQSISEFSWGFAKGLPKGVYESGEGMFLFLNDFVTHPIHTSGQIVESITTLVDLVRKDEWGVIAETLSPEMHQLVTKWDTLSSEKRGELAGFAVGKHGADILLPGAIVKVAAKSVKSAQELAAICKNLQIAQETLVLETAAGIGNSIKIAEVVRNGETMLALGEEAGFSTREIAQLKQAGKLELTITKNYEHLSPTMQESFALHKRAREALKPYRKQILSESQIRDLIHSTGIPTYPRPSGIPENYLVRITEKGAGMEYVHPTNPHFTIRIMPGKPHSSNLCQQKPYVIQKVDKGALDATGRLVSPDAIEAHIPLDEFIYKDYSNGY